LKERDSEKGPFAAAPRSSAHLHGELPPQATVPGPRFVPEFGNGVGVFVAQGLDGLIVTRDVAAETNAFAPLVAVTGLKVRDLHTDFDAIAES
jgi:hypothetical protein